MLKFLTKFFDSNEKQIEKLKPIVGQINSLAAHFRSLSDEDLKNKTKEFKERLESQRLRDQDARGLIGEGNEVESGHLMIDSLLPEAFAAVREA